MPLLRRKTVEVKYHFYVNAYKPSKAYLAKILPISIMPRTYYSQKCYEYIFLKMANMKIS